MNEKRKPLLPVVSPEASFARAQNVAESDKTHYAEQIYARVLDEQPHLMGVIENYIKQSAESTTEAAKMATVAVFMYELLSLQAEADELNKLFNIPE